MKKNLVLEAALLFSSKNSRRIRAASALNCNSNLSIAVNVAGTCERKLRNAYSNRENDGCCLLTVDTTRRDEQVMSPVYASAKSPCLLTSCFHGYGGTRGTAAARSPTGVNDGAGVRGRGAIDSIRMKRTFRTLTRLIRTFTYIDGCVSLRMSTRRSTAANRCK
jgi:hypothetical protein